MMTQRLDQARQDGERLIDLAVSHPDAAVPACPEWTATDLLTHITRVWGFIASHVERELGVTAEDGDNDAPLPQQAAAQLERVGRIMPELGAGRPMKTWGATQFSEFFPIRYRMETLIHRVDAEQAAGVESEIDGGDAMTGIDEWFRELAQSQPARPSGSLHLHRTDGEGEWTASVTDGEIVVAPIHDKASAALRGSAGDLLLALWRRAPLPAEGVDSPLELFGDEDVASEWLAIHR